MTVTVYTLPICSQCNMTKNWLDKKKIPYDTVDLSTNEQAAEAVRALGYMRAPVVIVNDNGDTRDEKHWYGFRPDMLDQFCLPDAAA